MSGGVDSSVTLLKTVEAGHEAIGVTMKLWESSDADGTPSTDSYCCSVEAINNAKLVCQEFSVPHYTLDYKDIFRRRVVDYLVEQYFAGFTPNPCIQCNIHLRWGALVRQADALDASWIATGHYARMDEVAGVGPVIRKGVDERKDQSYVLWGIDRKHLSRTLFPLGDLKKKEVRAIASEKGLVTADVAESQELCFLPDADYRRFLKEYAPERSKTEAPGAMVSSDGDVLGEHSGISNYTIGQRRKLGVTGPRPSYVRKIDRERNTITLAPRDGMYFTGCTISQPNWLVPPDRWPDGPVRAHIRYNHQGVESSVQENSGGTLTVEFKSPQFAVTPGQSAVFYGDDVLLGGGIIIEKEASAEQNGLDNHS